MSGATFVIVKAGVRLGGWRLGVGWGAVVAAATATAAVSMRLGDGIAVTGHVPFHCGILFLIKLFTRP